MALQPLQAGAHRVLLVVGPGRGREVRGRMQRDPDVQRNPPPPVKRVDHAAVRAFEEAAEPRMLPQPNRVQEPWRQMGHRCSVPLPCFVNNEPWPRAVHPALRASFVRAAVWARSHAHSSAWVFLKPSARIFSRRLPKELYANSAMSAGTARDRISRRRTPARASSISMLVRLGIARRHRPMRSSHAAGVRGTASKNEAASK